MNEKSDQIAPLPDASSVPPTLLNMEDMLQRISPLMRASMEKVGMIPDPPADSKQEAGEGREPADPSERKIEEGFAELALRVKGGDEEAGKILLRAGNNTVSLVISQIKEPAMEPAIKEANSFPFGWDELPQSKKTREEIQKLLKSKGIGSEGTARTFRNGSGVPRWSFAETPILRMAAMYQTAALQISASIKHHSAREDATALRARIERTIAAHQLPFSVETILDASNWRIKEIPEKAWELFNQAARGHPERVREVRALCIDRYKKATAQWIINWIAQTKKDTGKDHSAASAVATLRKTIGSKATEGEIRNYLKKKFLRAIPRPKRL